MPNSFSSLDTNCIIILAGHPNHKKQGKPCYNYGCKLAFLRLVFLECADYIRRKLAILSEFIWYTRYLSHDTNLIVYGNSFFLNGILQHTTACMWFFFVLFEVCEEGRWHICPCQPTVKHVQGQSCASLVEQALINTDNGWNDELTRIRNSNFRWMFSQSSFPRIVLQLCVVSSLIHINVYDFFVFIFL